MKEFFSKRKKYILDGLLVLGVLIGTAIISIIILSALNIISFDGEITFNAALFESFKDSWIGWLYIILFQVFLTILLCIFPGVSMAFIILCTTLYPDPLEAFLISYISVIIASFTMYFIGRFGGYKICVKMLGEKDCQKASELLEVKSIVYFPLMMLFPAFPDEALTMIAGTIKMKLRFFAPSVLLCRGVGIFTIVYGINIIPFKEFNGLYDWIVFITVCLVWLYIILHNANKLSRKIESKRKSQKNEDNN